MSQDFKDAQSRVDALQDSFDSYIHPRVSKEAIRFLAKHFDMSVIKFALHMMEDKELTVKVKELAECGKRVLWKKILKRLIEEMVEENNATSVEEADIKADDTISYINEMIKNIPWDEIIK